MKATAEHPFLGLGLDGFAMNRLGGTVSKGGHYSHSDISETLSCTGIPGFLLYYGIYLAFFNRLRRLRKSALPPQDMAMVNMIMAFLVVVLTAGVVGVFTTHRLQWPLIGAMCGYLGYLQARYGGAAGPAASTPAYGRGTA
jgi:O-antigen ligase